MEVDIEKIKRRMLIKYPFFGSIVANVEYKESKLFDTAATDGEIVYYNSDFLRKLDFKEQLFVMAHEIGHIAFNHIKRSEGKDNNIWNLAADAVLNKYLEGDGLSIIDGGVNMPDAKNYDVEELYDKLLKERKQQKQGNSQNQNPEHAQKSNDPQNQNQNNNQKQTNSQEQSQGNQQESNGLQNSSESQGQTNTKGESQTNKQESNNSQNQENNQGQSGSRDQSQENKQELNDSQNQENNQGQSGSQDQSQENKQELNDSQNQNDSQKQTNSQNQNQKQSDNNSQNNVGHDSHSLWENALNKDKNKDKEKDEGKDKNKDEIKKTQEECESLGEKEAFKENNKEREKILEKVENEITSHLGGNSSNGDIRKIGDIGSADTALDWRTLLDETIKYEYDWSYKNATIEYGVVIPHFEKMPFSETEIVVDTSGSVNEEMLKNFLRECKSILEFSEIKVGCFDTKFYGFNDIYSEADIDNLEFRGGGGTNFNTAVNAFSDSVDNKIIFTDGYAAMPDKELDAIWIVYGIDKIKPKGGRVIYINEEELKNLKMSSGMMRIRRK